MKKPTMQDIADASGVSRVTVWKVLNNHPGVSESMHYQIITEAIRLGYPIPDSIQTPHLTEAALTGSISASEGVTISVVVSRPDSSVFWINIIHQIAKEISKTNCSLMYTYVPTTIPEDYVLPSQLTGDTVQGLIILNTYDVRLLTLLNQLSVPKVFLDTVSSFDLDSLSGDLLLLEGHNSIEKVTDHLIQKGHRKIGFIGDIHYALTNQLRYQGFQSSMRKNRLDIDSSYCKTGTIGIDTYVEEITAYLNRLKELPDAFVCVSDFVAHVVYQHLTQNGRNIPHDLELTGYDNIADYLDLAEFMTTVNINTAYLGRRLFQQLLYRIQNPYAPLETIYLQPEIIYRDEPAKLKQ